MKMELLSLMSSLRLVTSMIISMKLISMLIVHIKEAPFS